MKNYRILLISILWSKLLLTNCASQTLSTKKTKCLNPPRTARRVTINIKECQEEVKNKLIQEALEILKEENAHLEFVIPRHDPYDRTLKSRKKEIMTNDDRQSDIYHPTLVPHEDKRIAGCLLHCVYEKNNAIDSLGWPTVDGLVNFYSEGTDEHGFFMATLQAVEMCLTAVNNKYNVNRRRPPKKGESCDVAFDVFDCVSDQITGYCLDHYRQ